METLSNEGKALTFKGQKPAGAAVRMVCLNFKVPIQVRQRFKIYAAQHDMTMTEMLLHFLDSCLSEAAAEKVQPHSKEN